MNRAFQWFYALKCVLRGCTPHLMLLVCLQLLSLPSPCFARASAHGKGTAFPLSLRLSSALMPPRTRTHGRTRSFLFLFFRRNSHSMAKASRFVTIPSRKSTSCSCRYVHARATYHTHAHTYVDIYNARFTHMCAHRDGSHILIHTARTHALTARSPATFT